MTNLEIIATSVAKNCMSKEEEQYSYLFGITQEDYMTLVENQLGIRQGKVNRPR